MCGIVGYLGTRNAVDVIMSGLHRLEYRGYDSAGIAVVANGDGQPNRLDWVKSLGKLAELDRKLDGANLAGALGIGHTRWATHGTPSEANSHPHFDTSGRIAVVHNGIIENFQELREMLETQGFLFRSQTDTETLAHLIRMYYDGEAAGDLAEAVRGALRLVQGAYAIGVVCADHPDLLIAARQGSPLVVGIGEDETFIASDVPALLRFTRDVVYLENGQICCISRDGRTFETLDGQTAEPAVRHIDWDDAAAEKEGFPHFMLKEIHQQPDVLRNVLQGRLAPDTGDVVLADLALAPDQLKACQNIVIVACGTAWHAGLVGKYLLERFAKIPVEVEVSSEYRYREPLARPNTLVIAVSQSGETADTLEAIRIAKQQGAQVMGVVNVVGSSIDRESDGVLYTHAGPEIGVASTKAYTSQLAAFALFTIYLARLRNVLSADEGREMVAHLRMLPDKIQQCLDQAGIIEQCSRNFKYIVAHSALYLGRTFNYPSALEGALKLKEISYIHAEGYAAGEMKHGPIALVTDMVPAICIAVKGDVYEKMISNIQEIRARQGVVLAIATEGDIKVAQYSDHVIYVPECFEPFSPIVVAIPIQLFAYYIATNRGCDVDQPRNLAKSVTVE